MTVGFSRCLQKKKQDSGGREMSRAKDCDTKLSVSCKNALRVCDESLTVNTSWKTSLLKDEGILKRGAPGETSGYYSSRFAFQERQYHSLPHHYKLPILTNKQDKEKKDDSDFGKELKFMINWYKRWSSDKKKRFLALLFHELEQPENHFLSILLQDKLHMHCPPNCQDLFMWLPPVLALKILAYLDPVSLARCSQVCKHWYQLANDHTLWQRLVMHPNWKLSSSGHLQHLRQMALIMDKEEKYSWKKVV